MHSVSCPYSPFWGCEYKVRLRVAKDRIDRDEEDLVRLYLTDIGQYTLLTKDDEVRLAKAIEAGKWEEAKALVAQINQVQREGHQKYRSESNDH